MPSQRKRIGFLPSEEVQNIIENICKENKYSHSKLTGILVEEALRARGVYGNSDFCSSDFPSTLKDKPYLKNINAFKLSSHNLENSSSTGTRQKKLEADLIMINEFIEYKFFKKIMKENRIYE